MKYSNDNILDYWCNNIVDCSSIDIIEEEEPLDDNIIDNNIINDKQYINDYIKCKNIDYDNNIINNKKYYNNNIDNIINNIKSKNINYDNNIINNKKLNNNNNTNKSNSLIINYYGDLSTGDNSVNSGNRELQDSNDRYKSSRNRRKVKSIGTNCNGKTDKYKLLQNSTKTY